MIKRVTTFLLIVCNVTVNGDIAQSYISHVKRVCGSSPTADAYVSIFSNLDVTAFALCDDNIRVPFNNTDNVRLYLPVSYPGQGTSPCVFKHTEGVETFVLDVIVLYGEVENQVHQRQFTLTCTFDDKAKMYSDWLNVSDALIAPVELEQNAGVIASNTSFELALTNIRGERYTGDVLIGRVVQLRASAAGAGSEVGLQPTSCDVVSPTTNNKYAILRGGCGDGLVFPKTEGFIVDGLTAKSPLFEAFVLSGDAAEKFECNFTMCMTNCDGSTCIHESKRAVETVGGTMGGPVLKTKLYSMKEDDRKKRSRPRHK